MSYRQSLYPGGSVGGSLAASSTPSASAVTALADKQRQVQHFHQILQHSQNLLELYQAYADKYHVLVGGSESVGDVVEHWQNVFRSTSLALGSIESQKRDRATALGTSTDQVELPPGSTPDQVVRIPVEHDQTTA
ncbi:uncharacterized protein JCM15063_002204 [Sporobolomyces koalae]|uniref:uncharacterized protein n=1 Tax=Sporobolomyces koalae TaxID=500713 RepID=UPI00316F3C58